MFKWFKLRQSPEIVRKIIAVVKYLLILHIILIFLIGTTLDHSKLLSYYSMTTIKNIQQ